MQSFIDSGPANAATAMPEPYGASDSPCFVAPAPDFVYLDALTVSVEAPVAITDVTLTYDPSQAVSLVDTPVVAVFTPVYIEPVYANPIYVQPVYVAPVYIEPAVLVLPSFNPYSCVLDGT